MQLKLIFTRKVLHLASFRKWEFLEPENGLKFPSINVNYARKWYSGNFLMYKMFPEQKVKDFNLAKSHNQWVLNTFQS